MSLQCAVHVTSVAHAAISYSAVRGTNRTDFTHIFATSVAHVPRTVCGTDRTDFTHILVYGRTHFTHMCNYERSLRSRCRISRGTDFTGLCSHLCSASVQSTMQVTSVAHTAA